MPYVKKPSVSYPSDDWGPWTAAHFQNQEARDEFLRSVANAQGSGCGAEPVADDGRGAWVRWRPGQFLGLNDLAYAHGGRIAVGADPHRNA